MVTERQLSSARNIAGDQTGFYPETLKINARKFLVKHGTDADRKILQRAPQKNVVRLGDSKVQRLGEYNNENSDSLASIL